MFSYGERVSKTMGVRLQGVVIAPFDWKKADDGTYRRPESHEKPVWVQWDNGTKGWIHETFLLDRS